MAGNDVIDWEKGKSLINGDEQEFISMLSQYESMSKFDATLEKIYLTNQANDYKELRAAAHFVKGSSR